MTSDNGVDLSDCLLLVRCYVYLSEIIGVISMALSGQEHALRLIFYWIKWQVKHIDETRRIKDQHNYGQVMAKICHQTPMLFYNFN